MVIDQHILEGKLPIRVGYGIGGLFIAVSEQCHRQAVRTLAILIVMILPDDFYRHSRTLGKVSVIQQQTACRIGRYRILIPVCHILIDDRITDLLAVPVIDRQIVERPGIAAVSVQGDRYILRDAVLYQIQSHNAGSFPVRILFIPPADGHRHTDRLRVVAVVDLKAVRCFYVGCCIIGNGFFHNTVLRALIREQIILKVIAPSVAGA